ncbi:hypothetical protein [Lacipirellula parvula]|uniref:Uncharacterized protein n=1 Tax=Lacipirellula parvula TaxID=2650471 RepID=A0A5K7X8A2_9BACT|nr:hypothetical protein [Lacipirellula parvula]BBO32102.1 hypothetical protein PLANPX_1714 [Lacipirellula parvula]
MFQEMFQPLSKHFDDGFGGVGDAFHRAAKHLLNTGGDQGAAKINGHLPINYLLRHTIELYLKSMILTLHRGFQKLENETVSTPEIEVGEKKPKVIFSVHALDRLWADHIARCIARKSDFTDLKMTDWSAAPTDLAGHIATIAAADPMSAAFRYPVSKNTTLDHEKSSMKQSDPAETLRNVAIGVQGKVILAVVDDGNDDGEVADTYVLDDNPIPELRDALLEAAGILEAARTGISQEMSGALST